MATRSRSLPANSSRNFFLTTSVNLESNYAIKTPDCVKILVWTIGLALGISLTIKDFVPLLSEYQFNNVAVQVELVLLDETFRPPQAVVNFPRQIVRSGTNGDLFMLANYLHKRNGNATIGNETCQLCEKLTEMSLDIWNDQTLIDRTKDHDFDEFYAVLSSTYVKKIAGNVTGYSHIFEKDHSAWNGPIVSAVMDYFEWQTRNDYDYKVPPYQPGGYDELIWSKLDIKDEILDGLFPLLIQQLCQKIDFTESDFIAEFKDPQDSNKTCIDLLLDADAPVTIDYKGLWVPLDAIENPSIKEYRFTFSDYSPALDSKPAMKPVTIFPDTGILYLSDIDGSYFPYLYQSPVEKKKFGQKVTVRYKVQMRAKENRGNQASCRGGSSVTGCFVQCTKKWVIEKCNCLPFSMRKGLHFTVGQDCSTTNSTECAPKLGYCSSKNFNACNITGLPATVKQQCLQSCKEACEYTSYTWQISYENFVPPMAATGVFILKMVPMFDTFAELTRTTKNTPEQFFSQLAGIANFYLGISGLSLFALITMCIDWWRRFKILKQNQGNDFVLKNAPWNGHIEKGWNENATSNSQQLDVIKSQRQAGWAEKEDWFLNLKESVRSELAKDMLITFRNMREKKRVEPEDWILELKALMIDELREEVEKQVRKKSKVV